MSANRPENLQMSKEFLQLLRLERLTDVVFALVIIRLFTLLPRPETMDAGWRSLTDMLFSNTMDLVMVGVGLVLVIIYWTQHNALYGNLQKTDNKHTVIAILQLFALLLFLYSVRMGSKFDGTLEARVFESGSAALVGIVSVVGWIYAIRNHRLVSPELTEKEARNQLEKIIVEPLVALLTIPFAFIGPVAWEIAWLAFIPVAQVIKRIRLRSF